MVDPAQAAFEPRLELRRILAKVVQQAGRIGPVTSAELGRALAGEVGHLMQMFTQRLPVGAVPLAG
jgi:hypothetical protein